MIMYLMNFQKEQFIQVSTKQNSNLSVNIIEIKTISYNLYIK